MEPRMNWDFVLLVKMMPKLGPWGGGTEVEGGE